MLALVGFAALTWLVGTRRLENLDLALMRVAHSVSGEWLDLIAGIVNYVAAAEVTLLLTASAAFLVWRAGVPASRASSLLLFLASVPIELVLKFTLDQPVPSATFYRETLRYRLFLWPTMQSFPSGHAIRTAFLATIGVYLLVRIVGVRRAALPAIVIVQMWWVEGWSRCYQGHHWPMDSLGGYLLGGGLAMIAIARLAPAWRESRGRRPTGSTSNGPVAPGAAWSDAGDIRLSRR
jgi:membrane-associated phospholipid phosphatase